MEKPFDGTESTIRSELVSDEELTQVLQCLHAEVENWTVHEGSPYDDWATVEAIAEATGRPETEVAETLIKVRRELVYQHLSERLNEADRVLNTVERPGNSRPDHVGQRLKQEATQTVLDSLPGPHRARLREIAHKRRGEIEENRSSNRMAWVLLLLMAFIVTVGMAPTLVQALRAAIGG